MAGMVAGTALMLYIRFFTPIAWTWYVLIGTSIIKVISQDESSVDATLA